MSAFRLPMLIGTSSNNNGNNRGIYAVSLDPSTGALDEPSLAFETRNPAFFSLHPSLPVVYASGEDGMIDEKAAAGAVHAYSIGGEGKLTRVSAEPLGGRAVTHLAADPTGRVLVAVSYHGGQIASFPLRPNGEIGPRATLMLAAGRLGPNTARQDKPHPHSVTLSPDGRHAYVCNLGLDRVYCFRLDHASGTIRTVGDFPTEPGSGPRHSKFSPDGRHFYVVSELDNTVTVFDCDAPTGALAGRQVVSTLPKDFTGTNTAAEIRVDRTGRFVYTSNRGHDSLAVFARHAQDGTLDLIEIVPCDGRTPRNFNLSPDGAWLVCANLESHALSTFRIDPATGRLAAAGHRASVPWPTCVLFTGR